MMAAKIFKTREAKARLEAWYDTFRNKIAGQTREVVVPTALGPSHVLTAGDPSNPPLVCLHGSLASSAHLLAELGPLLDRHYLVAPDLPGQSVKGPPIRVSYTDDTLPRWVLEVLDGLGVGEFDLLGVSWGGFAVRLTAAIAPDRVRKLVLLVPAGVVGGPVWSGLTKVAIPLALYRLFPTDRRLRALYAGLFTTWDGDWAHYLGDAFQGFVLDLRIPPLATDADLRGLAVPTLVIGGADDVSFPGGRLAGRVKGLVPGVEAEVLAGVRHGPPTTPEFRAWLAARVGRFLAVEGGVPA